MLDNDKNYKERNFIMLAVYNNEAYRVQKKDVEEFNRLAKIGEKAFASFLRKRLQREILEKEADKHGNE